VAIISSEIARKGKSNFAKFLIFSCFFVFLILSFRVFAAQAASLYFSPSSGSYNVGDTFSVSVYVSSADQPMNAAQGTITFPMNKLEVANLFKSGSIISFWVQEPQYTNSEGTVSFEGIVTNPGFTGSSGKVFTINFRVKNSGGANLKILSGSVLANDGQGTQILKSVGEANFALELKSLSPAPESTTISQTAGTPAAPKISSPTHPEPDKWYLNKNPKFTWALTNDISVVRVLYNKFPASTPIVEYKPSISEKDLNDLSDGQWYFHTQLQNNNGWGSISHFRFQIDTQPPAPFKIKFIDGPGTDNPRPAISFFTTDSLSGIDHYSVKIGDGDFFDISSELVSQSAPYILPRQFPGKHTVLVKAVDKAGNYTVDSAEFIIKPIPAPIITDYPKQIAEGDPLIISGKAIPNSTITLFLKTVDNGKVLSKNIKSDKNGFFNLVWQITEKDGGTATAENIFNLSFKNRPYSLWAEAVDDRGALSERSEIHTLIIKKGPLETFLTTSLVYLVIIVSTLAIILLVIYLIMQFWRKYVELHKRIKKGSQEPEAAISEYFGVLLKNIRSYLRLLEGAKTRKELLQRKKEIIVQIKNDLDSIEVLILKEIKDLEEREK